MAAKPKHEAPRRIIDNLGMLREALSKEAFACSGLHHVLVARNDNLGHEVMFGPNGFLQGGEQNRYVAHTALRGPLEVISFDGMSVLQPPEWTERGAAMNLGPMTYNWNPEARRDLIAKPGIIFDWTSPPMAGAGLTVYPVLSYSAGDRYPSDECRRMRLKKTSMYSKILALASRLVAKLSPRVNSFFRLAKKLSIGALSQQFARRLMLQVIPWRASRPW